jgi:hypothetical protein
MHIRRLVLAALGLGDMSDRSVSGVRDLSEGRAPTESARPTRRGCKFALGSRRMACHEQA